MGKSEHYLAELEELLRDPKNTAELAEKLMAQSNLPGPRGNLELAEAFVRAVSTDAAEPAAWLQTLYAWAGISAEEAPTGEPREFLTFCAVAAFGMLYNTLSPSDQRAGHRYWPPRLVDRGRFVEEIRRAAADPRWRTREAAAISLQHLGEGNSEALRRILDEWLSGGSGNSDSSAGTVLMERRAVLAALAHPPLLGAEGFARYALKTAEGILEETAAVPAERRKGEAFRILKKGLSYALSVMAAHLPEEGFPLLERWAGSSDPDIRRVLVANLRKKRMQAVDPGRTAGLLQKLGG